MPMLLALRFARFRVYCQTTQYVTKGTSRSPRFGKSQRAMVISGREFGH
jgi:hypothetical protein